MIAYCILNIAPSRYTREPRMTCKSSQVRIAKRAALGSCRARPSTQPSSAPLLLAPLLAHPPREAERWIRANDERHEPPQLLLSAALRPPLAIEGALGEKAPPDQRPFSSGRVAPPAGMVAGWVLPWPAAAAKAKAKPAAASGAGVPAGAAGAYDVGVAVQAAISTELLRAEKLGAAAAAAWGAAMAEVRGGGGAAAAEGATGAAEGAETFIWNLVDLEADWKSAKVDGEAFPTTTVPADAPDQERGLRLLGEVAVDGGAGGDAVAAHRLLHRHVGGAARVPHQHVVAARADAHN